MTDAEKREKVIRGLKACNRQSYNGSDCQNCPYYEDEYEADIPYGMCNIQDMFDDALALLKEQEPRVMTREEVLATPEGVVVWMEEEAESGTYIQPIVSTGNGCLGNFCIGVGAYGVEYSSRRFWTSRPTEEQRKAVLWDGERL